MIGVTFQGRLGNQLFQYAFAKSLSKKLQVAFFMDQSQEKGLIYTYFNIPSSVDSFLAINIFGVNGFKNIFNYHLRVIYAKVLNSIFTKNQQNFELTESINEKDIKDKKLYTGYFQSELFFGYNKHSILLQLEVKKKWQARYARKFEKICLGKKIVTIHIRKSDYENQSHLNLGSPNLSLPISYYHKVIFPLLTDEYIFIFTSDEPKKIEKEFSYIKNKIISYDDEITDLQHMINADICIIANSTFSWWGAYLNKKEGKKVFAPKYFLGFHINKTVPENIYPPQWTLVNLNN